MNFVQQSVTLVYPSTKKQADDMLRRIERAGRVCYKSEDHITKDSADKFCHMIIASGHESVLEHSLVTLRWITDRGVSHELVRHRIASYSQESTGFVNYKKKGLDFISPFDSSEWDSAACCGTKVWEDMMKAVEKTYLYLVDHGCPLDLCRSVLPNALKTEVVQSMNLREARHFLFLRTAPAAHPQMRELALSLLDQLYEKFPSIFADIKERVEE